MSQFLFVTDLDNTLVGDDRALAELNQHLQQHREAHGTVIVYATGRSLPSFKQLQTEQTLLDPDIRVLSVGTRIYRQDDTPDAAWTEYLSHRWDRDRVVATAAHFADLVPQAASEQAPLKVSFHLKPEPAAYVLPELEAALKEQGLEIQLIYSSNIDLDIVPVRSNKGAAINFLQKELGIAGDRTVVCGDSGNDLSMFQLVKAKGIIVGNAQPELLDWHQANPHDPDGLPARYVARSHCAGGILEGLRHFGFF
ncbi:sucrose-phosphate phosphatase [Microcoleus sp. FACHB-1515]|uniref:sucrose-phosphate phosphatase n=1 Tax=Cyanophyceae TaxID=3028117 RepID=UPI001685F25F|nr:sucrose-phosphate phosphatase [Microcoleus sp. FACHB-1515]MBD2088861.1 sucrose-phosphate phosphatase [Microcoleus sp. FACHB-1515]